MNKWQFFGPSTLLRLAFFQQATPKVIKGKAGRSCRQGHNWVGVITTQEPFAQVWLSPQLIEGVCEDCRWQRVPSSPVLAGMFFTTSATWEVQ